MDNAKRHCQHFVTDNKKTNNNTLSQTPIETTFFNAQQAIFLTKIHTKEVNQKTQTVK